MRVYKDKISGDELFTDAKKIEEDFDGFCYKVCGKRVIRTSGFDDKLIGANKSEEEIAEDIEDGSVTGIDVVLDAEYVETVFTKKQYLTFLKGYIKRINKLLSEDDKAAFKAGGTPFGQLVGKMLKEEFDEYQFYTGKSLNEDAMVILSKWEGETQIFWYIKYGTEDVKV